MEFTIETGILFAIFFAFGYALTRMLAKSKSKRREFRNVEWYGENIILKDKVYQSQEVENNIVQDVLDNVDNIIYKNKERQRIENVRNGKRNSGTNKVDATGPTDNTTKNES